MKSLRVYFVSHESGYKSGTLMRRFDLFFDKPPPAAFGDSEEAIFRQLERMLIDLEAKNPADVERYLWTETFETRRVDVQVFPQSNIGRRSVIGKRTIPLRLTFAYAPLVHGKGGASGPGSTGSPGIGSPGQGAGIPASESAGFRVMLPRFGWWFVLEDLDIAPQVIRQSIASALMGEAQRWVYEFRHEGEEYVKEWSPPFLERRTGRAVEDSDEGLFPTMVEIAEELVAKAERKRLAPAVGLEPMLDDHRALLDRERPRSLLLCGGPGVGKTAFVRRLAFYFLARKRGKYGKSDKSRRRTRLWATSGDRIIAGMVYLGMWQDRCLRMIDELSHEGDYLHVDRLADLMSPQSDGASIADLLAPAMIAEEISLIAECDESELERCRQKNPAFVDAFHLVRMDEMAPASVLELLPIYLGKKRSPLALHDSAYRRAVSHLDVFRRDLCFPGKAIQFFDWLDTERLSGLAGPAGLAGSAGSAGSAVTPGTGAAATPGAAASAGAPRSPSRGTLYPSDISAAFSQYSGLPVELISDDVPANAAAIASRLEARVIGQDAACETSARVLARFKAGLSDPDRPVGTLFFAGPTGVGKTELAKQLARYMFGSTERMVRVDMSEYMTPGSAQRLLEVGRGVTSLAQRVRHQPLTVVLFDEIEKAHPEVFDLLLGILGEGRLTDSVGRLVDFRMAVIIMTSNLGATQVRTSGFASRKTRDYLRSVAQHFRPEFFNRLDHILAFRALDRGDVERIVVLEIDSVSQRIGLTQRNVRIEVAPEAREALAEAGYDAKMGARPLKRVIEEQVVTPLAVKMAENPDFRDRTLWVVTSGGATWKRLSEAERSDAIVL